MRIINVFLSKPGTIRIEKRLITEKGLPSGFIITDTNLEDSYPALLEGRKYCVSEAGKRGKSIPNYERILRKLIETDEDTLVAFGGGMVGDLAGFVASTYKRGIPLIQVPTSLLWIILLVRARYFRIIQIENSAEKVMPLTEFSIAMVDSSIGGKNGINLDMVKNIIGTFYQPSSVIIDPSFLQTLPEKEFKNGIAEIIKYNVLFGKPDFERLKRGISKNDGDLKEIIFQCCKSKVDIVEIDEFDRNVRHCLNFGHTIGHAIKLLYNLSHGEAISIGMVKEAEIGEKLNLFSHEEIIQLKNILINNNLPTERPKNLGVERILNLIKQDKKGSFVFAFDEKNYAVHVDEMLVREVLK